MTSYPTPLYFNAYLGAQKPRTLFREEDNSACPFCARDELQDILAEEGSIIFLKNKYPVLKDTLQTVIIETDECTAEFSTYPKEHLYKLMDFSLRKWLEMEQSGEFTSVIFFKNHGPYSGGTIRHPHMQIVGLKELDYHTVLSPEQFHGDLIAQKASVEFNLSTSPRVGFFEFNVLLGDLQDQKIMADFLQLTTHYILHHFHSFCSSYNIFFYHYNEKIIAKIMPRFITSPLYMGYALPQVSSRAQAIIQEVQNRYF